MNIIKKIWCTLLSSLIMLLSPTIGFSSTQVRHYTFNISIGTWNILPDVKIKSLTINGQIPGPTIEVTEGDIIEIKLINNSSLPHTIHWHGLEIPNKQDGVPYVTQDPIEKGESHTYRFVAYPLEHISGTAIGAHCYTLAAVAVCMDH